MKHEETKVVSTRITKNLAELLKEHCKKTMYVNIADFIRDAIREKLQKDVPELYSKFFQEVNN
jgi:Arc/MetJ-type ribon-helix-helix transcriptional regulator